MDYRKRIQRKIPHPSVANVTELIQLPVEIQLHIWHCLCLKDKLSLEATCKTTRRFCEENESVYSVEYLRLVDKTGAWSNNFNQPNSHRGLFPKNTLQDELARRPVMSDLPLDTTWKKLLLRKTTTNDHWTWGQATPKVVITPLCVVSRPGFTFVGYTPAKVWVISPYEFQNDDPSRTYEASGFYIYKPKTGETWVYNLNQKEIADADVSGDFFVVKTHSHCVIIYRFGNGAKEESRSSDFRPGASPLYPDNGFDYGWTKVGDADMSAASHDQNCQCPLLKYHGFIDILSGSSVMTCRSPFLLIARAENMQFFLNIYDVQTLQCLKTIHGFDGRFSRYMELSSEFVVISLLPAPEAALELWNSIDFRHFTVSLASPCQRSILGNRTWGPFYHDPAGNRFIAVSTLGELLWISHFREFVKGEKTLAECAHFIDFSPELETTRIDYIHVKNGQVVIALFNVLRDAFPHAPQFNYTSIVSIQLPDMQDGDNIHCMTPQIKMFAPLAPPPGSLFVDEENVFITGKSDFYDTSHTEILRMLTKFVFLSLQRKHPGGIYWKDFTSRNLCLAWQHPVLEDSEDLDPAAMARIIQFIKTFCDHFCPRPDAIIAYCFAGQDLMEGNTGSSYCSQVNSTNFGHQNHTNVK